MDDLAEIRQLMASLGLVAWCESEAELGVIGAVAYAASYVARFADAWPGWESLGLGPGLAEQIAIQTLVRTGAYAASTSVRWPRFTSRPAPTEQRTRPRTRRSGRPLAASRGWWRPSAAARSWPKPPGAIDGQSRLARRDPRDERFKWPIRAASTTATGGSGSTASSFLARAMSTSSPRHAQPSVFEGQRALWWVFKPSEHSARLRSQPNYWASGTWSVEEIDAACNEVVKANGLTNACPSGRVEGSEQMGVSPKAPSRMWRSPPGMEQILRKSRTRLQLDIAPWRRPAPNCAGPFKGGRPLHDRLAVQEARRRTRL
jgi:hypothetical protein